MTTAGTTGGTFNVVREWAGYNGDPPNHDKVYACSYTTNGYLLRLWGRRGYKYQTPPGGPESYGSEQAAARAFDALVAQKRSSRPSAPSGYQEVAFNDPHFGNIPSWRSGAAATPGTGGEAISRDNLLRQIASLGQRLFQAGSDLAALIMEVTQVDLKAALFTQFAPDPAERVEVTAAVATLRVQVTQRLTQR